MEWLSAFVTWVYHWQTLAGGALALIGAGLTVVQIRRQIAQSERHEGARLDRRHVATRAVSALAFSQICRSCEQLITRLGALRQMSRDERLNATNGPLSLTLSNEMVPTLERLLEATGAENVVETVSELITRIQVTESRLESTVVTNDPELDDRMIDAACVYAFSERLLEYSRREIADPSLPIANDRLRSILRISHVRQQGNPTVHERLDRYYPAGEAFWDRLGHE